MYRIIKDGAVIATVDKLAFWRRQRNGVRILCPEQEASGIIVNDAFYHLPWRPESGGGEPDATCEEFDGAATIEELDEALLDATYQNIIGGLE